MKILIIKLSSIGDIIHTFPAIVDAKQQIKQLQIDWLIDENFKEVPQLQNLSTRFVEQIITIPLRKIKKNFIKNIFLIKKALVLLRNQKYDLVIDAQGLLKSAILAKIVKTKKICGYSKDYCREPIASCFYTNTFKIEQNLHAIIRIRQLFAYSLDYTIKNINSINYGLEKKFFPKLSDLPKNIDKYIVLLHGTTWDSKAYWSEYWQKLCALLNEQKIHVVVTAYTTSEQKLTNQLAAQCSNVIILSNLNIPNIACLLANATAVVAVDTGFAHLTSAMGVPIITIFGATSMIKVGAIGNNSTNLQSRYHCSPCLSRICLEYKYKRSTIKQPCLQEITPEMIFNTLKNKNLF